jgi:hypothetical protein
MEVLPFVMAWLLANTAADRLLRPELPILQG